MQDLRVFRASILTDIHKDAAWDKSRKDGGRLMTSNDPTEINESILTRFMKAFP